MNKALLVVAAVVVVGGIYFMTQGEKKKSLSMIIAMHTTEPQTLALEKLAKEYAKEVGSIEIEIMPLGSDTEAVLKTKMAANDLSDLWSTHGWSYMRYREYLEPMQTQPWAKDVNPLIRPAIEGPGGDFYVLPMDMEVSGLAYNADVLEKAGVDPDAIRTWDDLDDAFAKLKEAGVTPMMVGGKDIHPLGYFFIWTGQSFISGDPQAQEETKQIVAGTFPSEKWREMLRLLVRYRDKGYFNTNAVTASQVESIQMFAQGSCGFVMQASNSVIVEAMTYNPNAKLGFIPIPSVRPDTEPTLMTGERAAIGVWKDSKNKAEALAFIGFLARPESIFAVASAGGNPAGLTTTTSDTGVLKPFYAKYADIQTFPVFDRAYLPSGMWDTLGTIGVAILAGSMNENEALERFEAEYNRLIKQ